jgi:8-oxo-dGTP pyrophosphatase MutT (NUDIX family)
VHTPVHAFCSAGFFAWGDRVLLHRRDAMARVNPDKWAFFGGTNEGPETHLDCFLREIAEETGLHLGPEQVRALRNYPTTGHALHRAVFYVPLDLPLSNIRLTEGAGLDWWHLDEALYLDATTATLSDLAFFRTHVLAGR